MTRASQAVKTASQTITLRRQAVRLASRSILDAAERVGDDPQRPAYHFRPPAQWMNDPNGTFFHDGWHHLFYQHNPFGPTWGHMHWGHARSHDMIHWEHLPPALCPAAEAGENHCWSGAALVTDAGEPMMFYTSIGDAGRDPLDNAKQWIARGDASLTTWTQDTRQPLVTEAIHAGVKVYDWRDPYLFKHDGRWWMVLGGNLGKREAGRGVVLLYRAENEGLTDWSYRGVLYQHPEFEVVQVDCPNLIRIGDQWLLVFSPWHGAIRYLVGSVDFDKPCFTPHTTGLLDAGPDLFATNTTPPARRPHHPLVVGAWLP